MSEIVLVHLYPRELGINGDSGNVLALRKRAEWRGMQLRVVAHGPGDDLPAKAHLVHIGSGPAAAQAAVRDDLERVGERLREWAAHGVPFLAIAAGWQLLGRETVDRAGTRRAGAGIFPSTARTIAHRAVGEVVVSTEGGEVAGFENHSAVTQLDEGATPLGRTVRGRGNAGPGEDIRSGAPEGVLAGNSIGTNLHGPFLPMNPVWADRLLAVAAERAGVRMGSDDDRIARADEWASKSRQAIRRRLGVQGA